MSRQTEIDRDALLIGQRLLFEIRHDRLTNVTRPEYQIELQRAQTAVLVQIIRAPREVLNRQRMLENVRDQHDLTLSGQMLDELVSALCAALERLDPGEVYIRTLPRLGYVLLHTVTSTRLP